MKIAIIGAGAAGLSAARFCLNEKHKIDVFEQTGNFGGTWVYTDAFGVDENGILVHSSMYQGLRTNLPKELMEFEDFHYPAQERSFISQPEVLAYIQQFVKEFKLEGHITFFTQVIEIDPLENGKWKVKTKNLKTHKENVNEYDSVLICNGHYHKYYFPDIPGKDLFKGTCIHSHFYRSQKPYKDRRVTIIGCGPSGVDIARLVGGVAKKVFLSCRGPLFNNVTGNAIIKPQITNIKKTSIIFEDNSEEEIDDIIFCTGYKYFFPFLTKNCKIEVDNNWVKHLYKQIININHPTMAIIGVPFKICPFPVHDIQIRFFLSYLKGNFSITKEEMFEDLNKEIQSKKEQKIPQQNYHILGDDQGKYCEELAKFGNIYSLPSVISKLYIYHKKHLDYNNRYKILNNEEFQQY